MSGKEIMISKASQSEREPLIDPNFLFRFSVPCLWSKDSWTEKGVQLRKKYLVPSFGELLQRPVFADLRIGWNEEGLFFTVRVSGKKNTPWCRSTRIEDSDGLQVWIDTRDTHTTHRAGRFCHRFVFLPFGGGGRQEEPVADWLPVARAREAPRPASPEDLAVRSEQRIDGYVLEGFIAAAALTGYDPQEHPRLGFTYAVIDRELGWQTLSLGPEYSFREDPSLWGTLELVRS